LNLRSKQIGQSPPAALTSVTSWSPPGKVHCRIARALGGFQGRAPVKDRYPPSFHVLPPKTFMNYKPARRMVDVKLSAFPPVDPVAIFVRSISGTFSGENPRRGAFLKAGVSHTPAVLMRNLAHPCAMVPVFPIDLCGTACSMIPRTSHRRMTFPPLSESCLTYPLSVWSNIGFYPLRLQGCFCLGNISVDGGLFRRLLL